jgi:MoaA/NifB/PqqE/SkfB family radical SAM enzyme
VGENEWALFSLYDGLKYGVVFDSDGRQTATPMKAARALEMVDVSISNACGQRCSFCYRASEPDGQLADINDLKALVKGLKEIDTMELVIGGGEPTEHPDFYRFLKEADFGDLCVSFTTRNLDFIRSFASTNGVEESEVVEVIRNKAKAIGISVRTAEEVKEAERNLVAFMRDEAAGRYSDNPQMVFHLIPGPDWEEVFDVITEEKHSLLLLGMKFTGRNEGTDRKIYADTLRAILKDQRLKSHIRDSFFRRYAHLGVDTKFIIDVQSVDPDWLKQFDRKSWANTEGVRSAFIDLVDGTMAPCSFGGKVVKLDGYDGRSLNQGFGLIGTYKPEGLMGQPEQ